MFVDDVGLFCDEKKVNDILAPYLQSKDKLAAGRVVKAVKKSPLA